MMTGNLSSRPHVQGGDPLAHIGTRVSLAASPRLPVLLRGTVISLHPSSAMQDYTCVTVLFDERDLVVARARHALPQWLEEALPRGKYSLRLYTTVLERLNEDEDEDEDEGEGEGEGEDEDEDGEDGEGAV